MNTHLAIFVCVWDPATDDLLFEGSSPALTVEKVREVVGPDAFPADPEIMAAHPVSDEHGRKLLDLMGTSYAGEGEFQVSREYVSRRACPGLEMQMS